jgi:tetratricopeptide (TPR) repeat protein
MMRCAPFLPNSAATLLLVLMSCAGFASDNLEPACVNGRRENPDISEKQAALQRTPTMMGKRMELAGLLQKAGCYDDAVTLLDDGKKYNPFNPALLFDIRRARNLAYDEHHRESVKQTDAISRQNRIMQRCTEGDGTTALQACKSALVKGAPNEFEMTVRIALLQQSINQAPQALDSYIAANSLKPGDKGVALAILALLDSTQRKDAMALAARGSSLLTLSRGREALAALRQAKSLEPELPDINRELAAAEALARSEAAARKERPKVAAINAASEAMVEPQTYSNVAEASRSN